MPVSHRGNQRSLPSTFYDPYKQKDSKEKPVNQAPTSPPCARVVGYGPFSFSVIHEEGLCPSNGGINMLMMMSQPSFTHL
jgi:hypothetical protein